eukprot:gnl/TRDRNA2_/TRDRNA2_170250_c0_seq2.p1 gnl/TRDRNA2_/TRDRNA2_170250_c0~~gnl/TRDRNA2_/TRDRNA2_170250_c0_seq2.p1  ORF type:complete len:535 (+),score=203.59 gnl/TRDRNA2_/TRDRNA2_170250_c0_seq2:228-1607(+)
MAEEQPSGDGGMFDFDILDGDEPASAVEEELEAERVAEEKAEDQQKELERLEQERTAEEQQRALEQAEEERKANEQQEEQRKAKEQAETEQNAEEQAAEEWKAKEQAEEEEKLVEEQDEEEARAAEERAAEERGAEERAAEERAAEERAVEQAAEEPAAEEQAAKEPAAKEKKEPVAPPAWGVVVKDCSAEERAADERAASERQAKEQAAKMQKLPVAPPEWGCAPVVPEKRRDDKKNLAPRQPTKAPVTPPAWGACEAESGEQLVFWRVGSETPRTANGKPPAQLVGGTMREKMEARRRCVEAHEKTEEGREAQPAAKDSDDGSDKEVSLRDCSTSDGEPEPALLAFGDKRSVFQIATEIQLAPDTGQVATAADIAPFWEVVGGDDKGGIVVREGKGFNSRGFPTRLSTGALIKALVLDGDRLQYKKVSGHGPSIGWVSVINTKGKELVVPTEKRPIS